MIQLYKDGEIDVKKCLDLVVQSQFAGYWIRGYQDGFLKPTHIFKKDTGIYLGGGYDLGGLDADDIELYIHVVKDVTENYEELLELYKDLAAINPQLADITNIIKNSDDLYHAMLGITSDFNSYDIEFYMTDYEEKYGSMWMNYYNNNELIDYTRWLIHEYFGPEVLENIQWIMSPTTAHWLAKTIESLKDDKDNKDI